MEKNSTENKAEKRSELDNIRQRIAKLIKHKEKNKTDKSMLRCLLIKQAKRIKLEKFKK